MIYELSERAEAAVVRYGFFVNVLRSQHDTAFRRGGLAEVARQEAVSVSQGAARTYLSTEQGQINGDTDEVAKLAHAQALSDLALPEATIDERFGSFVFDGAYYVSRIIAAQAERDVMSLAQHLQATAQRIDLYVRSGAHTRSSAAAQIMLEDNQAPAFRFIDRMGRKFKSSKHIRDIYRLHLLNTYNEVYMDVVAEHGWEIVKIRHPDPSFKWQGEPVAIVGRPDKDFPLYYDIRDEVFHPSSQATLSIL